VKPKRAEYSGRKLIRVILGLLGAALIAVGIVVLALVLRDPLRTLPKTDTVQVISESRYIQNGRQYRQIQLNGGTVGSISILMSLPHPIPPDERLPVLVVLGGLPTAEENMEHLPELGDNVVITYDWPFPMRTLPENWYQPPVLWNFYNRASTVPGQVAAATEWAVQLPFSDPNRLILSGFSLGALATPATQRILEAQGQPVYTTILAYGGAPIGDLAAHHLGLGQEWLRPAVRSGVNLLIRHLDPVSHLPHLHGHFLFMHARDEDIYVPWAAVQHMQELTPEPKTVVLLDGGHMGVAEHQQELLEQIIQETVQWLGNQRAIRPIIAFPTLLRNNFQDVRGRFAFQKTP
jgi:dienelactone hydrolase